MQTWFSAEKASWASLVMSRAVKTAGSLQDISWLSGCNEVQNAVLALQDSCSIEVQTIPRFLQCFQLVDEMNAC